MKIIKSILLAASLIAASATSTIVAQEAADTTQVRHTKFVKGDTIILKRECTRYLTGEKPSRWVYHQTHTILKVGGHRFPDGLLINGILSWVAVDDIENINGRVQEAREKAIAEEEALRAAEKEAQEKAAAEEKARRLAEKEAAERAAAEEAARLAAEQQAAEAQPAADSTEVTEQEPEQEPAKHNYDRFTLGVRGGAAGLLHNVERGKWNCGFDALLDLQYAHYWAKEGRPVDLGLIVGLGIGYSQSGMQAAVDTAYTVSTVDGDINYTLKADQVKENDGQIQLEVPIMFSLIHESGFFFNIGPKFMIPVYTPYNQKITNPQINAYFPAEGVNVSNEVITGFLKDNQLATKGTDNGNQFAINVLVTAELGYEWTLKSGNSFGLGAYANYCVYNTFANKTTAKSLMDVTAPTASSVASVDVLSATKTYAKGLGYFDAGLKLAYHFNFPKKQKKSINADK